MEIKSLGNTSFDELFGAFEQAFVDYEIQINKAEHLAMLKRRGFDPKLSFGAFDNSKIVSFTCNGIGNFYGTPTAYDTGTGTLKEYRGQGLATRIFEESIPYLKEAGIKEYLLEVLQHNTGAVSVYTKIGFQVTREFYYFRQQNDSINHNVKAIEIPYTLQPIDINDYDDIPSFWDFRPSWQNSRESINRRSEWFISLGVFADGKLIGYGVAEPESGDITQLAVHKAYRRKGFGSLLFQKITECSKCNAVKIINTEIGCDSITAFLHSKNIEPSGKQYEMIRKL